MHSGTARLLILVIAVAMVMYGVSEPATKSVLDPKLREIAEKKPEGFMEGVHQRRFDTHGALESTLVAVSLLDFGDRANAHLESPKLWLERPPATWYIEGQHGELSADRNHLTLSHDVIANRLEDGTEPWRLSGETLKWDQTTDLVTSNTTTVLVQGKSHSQGDSIVMDLNTSQYTLGDKVKTQWQSTPSSQSR